MTNPFQEPLFVGKALFWKVHAKYPEMTEAQFIELGNLVANRLVPGERMSLSRMYLEICEQYQRTHD